MIQGGRSTYVPGSNRNYEPIWYDADVKPISAYMDVEFRSREAFAWYPIKSDFGSLIWLKSYIVYERFVTINSKHKVLHSQTYSISEYVEAKLKGEIKVG